MLLLYFIGRRRGKKIFLALEISFSALYDVWPDGKYLCLLFLSVGYSVSGGGSLYSLVWTFCLYCDPLHYVVRMALYIQHLGQSYMTLIVVNIIFSFMHGISLAGHLGVV